MDEICEVCGRISVATYGLGTPGTPIDKVCFRVKAGADTTCYVIGYERASETLAAANARAEKAEADAKHARGVLTTCAREEKSHREALAAARRECDEQREAKEAAYNRIYKALAALDAADLWSTRVINARAALASPGAGEEGT